MADSGLLFGRFKLLIRCTAQLAGVLIMFLALLAGWNYFKWRQISKVQSFENMEHLDLMISKLVANENVPGLAVSIVFDGRLIWSRGYGFANIANKSRVTPDTPFLIGSVSKIYTGIGVMQVVEDGQLSLDTDINNYLTFSVENSQLEGEAITLRNLASHTSGIVDNVRTASAAYQVGDTTVSLAEYLQDILTTNGDLSDADISFTPSAPGTAFSYSNTGVSLAAELVEAVTGTRLDSYTQTSIFDALGMKNTGWHLSDFVDQSEIATPYNQSYWLWVIGEEYLKGNPRSSEQTPLGTRGFQHITSPSYPMGGLRSSVNDQGIFLATIMNGGEYNGARIIDSATLNLMFEPQIVGVNIEDSDVDVQGLFWVKDSDGYWGHTGGDIGSNNIMFFDRKTSFGGVISLNLGPTIKSLAVRQRVMHQIMNHQEHIRALIAE